VTGRLAPGERALLDQNQATVDHAVRHIRAHHGTGRCDEPEACPGAVVNTYLQRLPCNQLETLTMLALIQLAARAAELEALRGDPMPPLDLPDLP
jgi:hypothetical protein